MVAEAGHQDRAVEGASFEPVTSDDVAAIVTEVDRQALHGPFSPQP